MEKYNWLKQFFLLLLLTIYGLFRNRLNFINTSQTVCKPTYPIFNAPTVKRLFHSLLRWKREITSGNGFVPIRVQCNQNSHMKNCREMVVVVVVVAHASQACERFSQFSLFTFNMSKFMTEISHPTFFIHFRTSGDIQSNGRIFTSLI